MWRRIWFGSGLGFSVCQSQSWRGARAGGCRDKQRLLWGSLSRERDREVRLHGHRHRGGVGGLACFCLRPLNLGVRLSWPGCRYGWEARLFYSCLGPLCLLGDLRHLAAWRLARLAELGGLLAGLCGLGRLCGLHGLGRLCRLCRLSGLQGLTFRSWALEFGRGENGVESVLYTALCPYLPPNPLPWAPGQGQLQASLGSQAHSSDPLGHSGSRALRRGHPLTLLHSPAQRRHPHPHAIPQRVPSRVSGLCTEIGFPHPAISGMPL